MTVAQEGEFGLIDRLTARLPLPANVPLGPGDDAAVVSAPDGRIAASTDILVESRHFRRDWCSARDIGHRAAAANLADIAAMGAVGTALLVGLCAPADTPTRWAEELADGLAAEAALVGAAVVGGDISAGPTLMIAVTALGDLQGRPPVRRSGARPTDVVAMAGRIGYAAAGYALLARGMRTPERLIEAYRRPQVPYQAGPLAALGGATSMIDVSDGLVADLGHVAVASGVHIDIRRDAFDVPQIIDKAARTLDVDPMWWILGGGDDHPLVATFPAGVPLPPGWRAIGTVHRIAEPSQVRVTLDGEPYHGPPGWQHFTQDS